MNKDANILVDGQPATTQAIPSPDGGLKYWHGAATLDNATAPAQKDAQVTAGLPEGGPSNEDLYDQGNKQLTLPKHPEEFLYDDDGNLIQDGLRQYTWDAENRLIGVEPIPDAKWHGAQKATYTYDIYSRRIRKHVTEWDNTSSTWSGNKDVRCLWDDWLLVAGMKVLDGTPTLNQIWTWGLDLNLSFESAGGVGGLLWCEERQSLQSHSFAYDGNGNVVITINNAGIVSAMYQYATSGKIVQIEGEYATINAFKYGTKFLDATEENGGLMYYGFRYLNPATGGG